jgi:hypothetical protein
MPLVDLPNELLLSIADHLRRQRDISAFARSSRRLYGQVNRYLYQRNIRKGRTHALFWATECGREATALKAIDAGADVNLSVSRQGRHMPTALHVACARGSLSFVALLLSNGASVNATTIKGVTPLHIACYFRIAPIVELLLELGANVSARDIDHQTPLQYAVGLPVPDLGAESVCPTKIQWAVRMYDKSDEEKWVDIVATVEYLLAADADPTMVDRRGASPESTGKYSHDLEVRALIIEAAVSTHYEAGLVDPEMKEKARCTRRQALQAGRLAREKKKLLIKVLEEEAESSKQEEVQRMKERVVGSSKQEESQGMKEQEIGETRGRKAKRAIERKLQSMRQWWRQSRETHG